MTRNVLGLDVRSWSEGAARIRLMTTCPSSTCDRYATPRASPARAICEACGPLTYNLSFRQHSSACDFNRNTGVSFHKQTAISNRDDRTFDYCSHDLCLFRERHCLLLETSRSSPATRPLKLRRRTPRLTILDKIFWCWQEGSGAG